MDDFRGWYLPIVLVALAAVGGFLGSIFRALDSDGKIVWFVIVVETFASAFSGVIVMLLCQAVGLSAQWTGVIVGVCGWFGGRTTMVWLERRVRRIIEGEQK